ncbi:hypothetical protein DdX_14018 [Ditylenchus destructor]|uniref:Uncharacterized protein n=1 Tax=Ditylenchus destructor TaxID=166010 RepID=A0AAD4MXM1_9BILA|nr:hypothetical protein DdX_14018 [Ditylenchus destructor]
MYPDLDFSSLLAEDLGDFPMDDESHDDSSHENEINERPRLNMKKKLREFGLIHRYDNEADFALYCRMIPALSSVRLNDEPKFAEIQPRFPHQLWSVHQRTIEGKHRTNNYAEAGNRRIQSEMGMETPTMGYFIDRLKLIQRGRDQAHVRWLQGYQARPKKTKYRMADERILKVIDQYATRSPIEFLGGVALNFMMD